MPQASGAVAAGNIDLYAQPKVKNSDGSVSTVDSIGVNIDGKEYLLPTVTPDGRHFTGPKAVDQAVAEFKKTGRHLGVFDSVDASNRYAEHLHTDYEAGKYDKRGAVPEQEFVIVDGQGTEHAFPAGFDPKRAASIVKSGGYWDDKAGSWHSTLGDEKNRPDNTVLGLPPELAVIGALNVGRAATAATGMAAKASAGLTAAAGEAAPIIKYQALKHVLEAAGVPSAFAEGAAMILAGYRTGGVAKAASTVERDVVSLPGYPRAGTTPPPAAPAVAAEAAPVAAAQNPVSAPAAPAPLAAPVAAPPVAPAPPPVAPRAAQKPAATPVMPKGLSPQRIQNELGLAARRANARLTEAEYATAAEMVKQGVHPVEAVLKIKAMQQTGEQAAATLAQRLGTPSPADVAAAVAERNKTGRWQNR